MSLTNNSNIPLSAALYLATNSYDFKPDPRSLSATDFNKSIRQVILRNRTGGPDSPTEPVDIASLVKSKMGTAIHDSIEKTWLDPQMREAGLRNLGYPESVIKRIVVNPTEVTAEQIPVYMEIRKSIKLGDWTISGKFDFVAEGALTDYKSTSTWTAINKVNDDKYRKQGSIYKVIHKDIITNPHLTIVYWFTDWKEASAKGDPTYPQSPVLPYKIKLMDEDTTIQFMQSFINQLEKNENTPEPELPYCTKEELWQDDPVYKYYRDPMKKARATKNFDSLIEARKYFGSQGGVGEIVTVPGRAMACNYCSAAPMCSQYKQLKAQGLIKD